MKANNKVVKVGKHYFKYDREHAIVKMYSKLVVQELKEVQADNEEWQKKYGEDLFEIEDGNLLFLDEAGLRRENWDNAEARRAYLEGFNDQLEEEVMYMI